MTIVRAGALAAGIAAGILAVVPLKSQSRPGTRERVGAAGAAIVLGLPPAEPQDRPDTTGASTPVPSVWVKDPVTGAEYRSDYLLVRFRENASAGLRATALAQARALRTADRLWDGWERADVEAGATVESARATLAGDATVSDAAFDYRVYPFATRPNDEFFSRQWNFEALDMPRAWDINDGASDQITVAVVDTGLNTESTMLTYPVDSVGAVPVAFAAAADLVTPGRIVAPFDFVWNDDMPMDTEGHGSHVAGTIAQLTGNSVGVAGIAHKVRVMPLKVLASNLDVLSGRSGGSQLTVATAIRYAADHGAHVINLSLGGPGSMPLVRDALLYAVSRGAFLTIAAGNDGDEGNPVEYPASYAGEIDGVMAVGAVGRDLRRASYSGFKPYVEICAPGGDDTRSESDVENGVSQMTYRAVDAWYDLNILEAWLSLRLGRRPRYDRFAVTAIQGTSMAAPHVAGVAALLYSQGLRNPAAVERAIKRFARPIDARPDECGAGLVDPRGALRGMGLLQ